MKAARAYDLIPFPIIRQPIVDGLQIASRMKAMHALFEADVTNARRRIRELRREAGRPLSLTAFLAFCLAQAVAEDRSVHAYRRGRKLIIHRDVGLAVIIERKVGGQAAPLLPLLIKGANRKTPWQIEAEIAASRTADTEKAHDASRLKAYGYIPKFLRLMMQRAWMRSPRWREALTGTVGLSAVGMFGSGTGWGIPIPSYTLSVTGGTIAEKPVIVRGTLCSRQLLSLTASFDHAVVDGAPAARFTRRFKELIETCHGLSGPP